MNDNICCSACDSDGSLRVALLITNLSASKGSLVIAGAVAEIFRTGAAPQSAKLGEEPWPESS
jgi:hypothetical protein